MLLTCIYNNRSRGSSIKRMLFRNHIVPFRSVLPPCFTYTKIASQKERTRMVQDEDGPSHATRVALAGNQNGR